MSIKKKFATAVATAGLLAGLFGSAFVPTATARGGSGSVPAKALSDWWVPSQDWFDDNQDGIDNVSAGLGHPAKIVIASHQDTADTDLSLGFYFADSGDDAIETVDLSATSTGFLEVAWAYRERIHADGEGMTKRVDCDWSYLDNKAFGLTDEIAGVKNDGDPDQGFIDDNPGTYYLCVRVKDSAKPGSGTITVKANGATVFTVPFTVLGDLATLTLSAKRGYTSIAEANHEIDAFFTVVGKDSAGQVINATGDGIDNYLNDYTDNPVTEAGTDSGDVIEDESGDTMNFVDDSFDYSQTLDLNANVCDAETYDDAGDGDAGHSYPLAIEMENWDGDIITSNSVTISCTGPTSDAVLSNIVAETATGEADWAASDAGEHKVSNFLRQIIEKDLELGTYASRRWAGSPGDAAHHAKGEPDPAKIRTRFPPEPNGYLHVGHAKSICINFGLAKEYGGVCHLRFDDTNPEKEDTEYVNSIIDAVQWLGFSWSQPGNDKAYQASDYFDFMYRAAEHLIEAGHAYVDEQTPEEMRVNRGDFGKPGVNSPYRDRANAENLARFREMPVSR